MSINIMERRTLKCNDKLALDELVLLQQIGIIAGFPYSIEERFDLAFLHAAAQPLRALHRQEIEPAQVFAEELHDYRVTTLNYLTRVFMTNMANKTPPWSSLCAESIGVLDRRRLFTDEQYRTQIMDEYTQILSSGILDQLM